MRESCLTAATTPSGMEISEAMMTAITPSWALTAMRGSIRSATGSLLVSDWPKSPRRKSQAHSP